ncbi:unnamed protein product [Caenorhabditis auriculariae]|uniref:UPAR/Ly6 domain-containing protein n=1 Tax=Caenorhabditis auriculariae TaxID=2777116 RepID=A0A8S1GUB0_9PELO|nr:unnamed protein product [Caenorhabditis auriculariae]
MWLLLTAFGLHQLQSVASLDCFSCGVFLSAPTAECRGVVRNNSCAPQNYGCLSVIGQNSDSTYYVEKRCAEKSDDLKEGCIDIGIRGIAAKQCLCKTDFCNSSKILPTSTSFLVLFAIASLKLMR